MTTPNPEVGDLVERPIDMILHCPACGLQHIDATELRSADIVNGNVTPVSVWTNPPHRSHLCQGCGHIWRPADVPTNGVGGIQTQGQNDSPAIDPRVCEGCGTSHPATDYPPPGPPYSCCPERKMLSAKQWAARAEAAESALAAANSKLEVADQMARALEPFVAMAEAVQGFEGPSEDAVFIRLLRTERHRSGLREHIFARLTKPDFDNAAQSLTAYRRLSQGGGE